MREIPSRDPWSTRCLALSALVISYPHPVSQQSPPYCRAIYTEVCADYCQRQSSWYSSAASFTSSDDRAG